MYCTSGLFALELRIVTMRFSFATPPSSLSHSLRFFFFRSYACTKQTRCKRMKSIWLSWLITPGTSMYFPHKFAHTQHKQHLNKRAEQMANFMAGDGKCIFIRINLHIRLFSSCHKCEQGNLLSRHCVPSSPMRVCCFHTFIAFVHG